MALLFSPCHVAALFTKLCRDEFKETNKNDVIFKNVFLCLNEFMMKALKQVCHSTKTTCQKLR